MKSNKFHNNFITPLEYIYYIGYRLHKGMGAFSKKRLDGFTISVGNITMGGTGKTPLVIEIAKESIKRGFITCILTRGYKAKSTETLIVSKGDGPTAIWEETGDEPYMMAKKLKKVWIVKDKNRYRGGLISGKKDIFILDDGYQHWRLHRDIDIVVIDGTKPFGNGMLLPFGNLREPPAAIKRADVIIINKVDTKSPELEKYLRHYNHLSPIYYANYEIEGFSDYSGKIFSIKYVVGKNVFVFSGIGNHRFFTEMLIKKGINIIGSKRFTDHYYYNFDEIKKILKSAESIGAELILTTEKDMVKIEKFLNMNINIPILAVNIRNYIKDENFYNILFSPLGGYRNKRIV